MAQSFPALCLRIMTHCVKEEVVRQKRAINGQRGKKNPNPFPLVSISVSILSQDSETSIFFKFFLKPEEFYKLSTCYLCTFFCSHIAFLSRVCPHLAPGVFVAQALKTKTDAFSTPLFHPYTAVHQVLNPARPCPFAGSLAGV